MSRPASRSGLTLKPRASRRASAPDCDSDRRRVLDELVRPGRQQPGRRHGRVLLAERARAAVPWVGVQRQLGCLALLVDALEFGLRHEDLAADVDGDRLGQRCRDGLDRPQVRGDVLAGRAVAAGRTLHEAAALVAQGDRQAIDLEFCDVLQVRGGFGRRRQAQALADARIERPQLVVAEGVGETEHRPAMADLTERAGWRATDALGG